jgi:hypothetical protein
MISWLWDTSLSTPPRKHRVSGAPVMPEHFHILISEPRIDPLAIAMRVLKQRVSLNCPRPERAPTFWLPRYYGFNVFTNKKKVEKLRYTHRNLGSPASPLLACWGGSRSKRKSVIRGFLHENHSHPRYPLLSTLTHIDERARLKSQN